MSKILVIEDNPVEIETIKTRLTQNNYEVLLANSGEEGIRLAQQQKPDLIFMDMILPGMHGLEATIKLKKNPETKDIPIVALTVMDSSEFVATCFKEGISAFIRKPYDFREIFEKTKQILGFQKKGAKRILISDRESSVVTMMAMSLMKSGYQVTMSQNGESNSTDIINKKPDVILSDGSISPDGSLFTSSIPIILLTEQTSPEKVQKLMARTGAKDYLSKPISSRELIAKIEKVLNE